MAYLKRTFQETKKVKVVKSLSTKNSTLVHVNHKAAVLFLRKVNEVELYYKGFKYNFAINNDKEVLELGEKKIVELIEKYLKEYGEKGKQKIERKKRGRKAINKEEKGREKTKKLKEETIEVKEKKRRGRPKKVK